MVQFVKNANVMATLIHVIPSLGSVLTYNALEESAQSVIQERKDAKNASEIIVGLVQIQCCDAISDQEFVKKYQQETKNKAKIESIEEMQNV